MNRIFCANMMRLKKNKLFWLGIVFVAGYGILNCYSSYRLRQKFGTAEAANMYSLDGFLFSFMPVIGIVLSVVISMYLGTDYSDGTIRNKIMAGKSRSSIYAANYLASAVIGIVTYCIGILVVFLVGRPLFGGFRSEPFTIAGLLAEGMLMVLASASIFNLLAMLIPNKAHSAVFSILLAFGLLFFAVYLVNMLSQPKMIEEVVMSVENELTTKMVKNPHYLSDVTRKVYYFLLDLLPAGQGMQLASLEVMHPYRMAGCSIVLAAALHVAGSISFQRKNIK